ncbi:MAG: prepilin-type N-terminal cleavage/methylation domain-containing protein [Pirellulales bacterium]|nr:prepilin-type N-terminal cleavage/methylation domain-containing protein [Pirellulales bacterium]
MLRVKNKNHGLTLIELLVTMMIMGIMIAIAVPVIRPPVDARAVKEAAQMVSTALASARTRAIETGQNWGIQLEPLDAAGRQAGTLHFVQVVPPYTGSGTVSNGSFSGLGNYANGGGMLKLNFQGSEYRYPDDNTDGTLSYDPPPDGTYDFQFYPAPRKSAAMPMQLPSRAVIDVGLSGWGDAGSCFTPSAAIPVKITFKPTGEVDQIYHGAVPGGEDVVERVHLLVGKPGRTDTSSTDPQENHLLDGEAIWVSLDPRTGAVKAVENKPDSDVDIARTWAEE